MLPSSDAPSRILDSLCIAVIQLALLMCASVAMPAYAADSDCIEHGGKAICTRPMLGQWQYGICINNSLTTTLNAQQACANEVGYGSPFTDASVLKPFIECLPREQYGGVCHVDPVSINWAAYGSVENSYSYQCGAQVANDTSGFAVVFPTFKMLSGGNCTGEHGYYAVIATKGRTSVCPQGYNSRTGADGQTECWKPYIAPSCESNQPAADTCGNPFQPASGRKLQTERDYDSGSIGLRFVRSYSNHGYYRPLSSQGTEDPLPFGESGAHTYQSRVYAIAGSATVVAVLFRPNGDFVYVKHDGYEYLNTGPSGRLEQLPSGWKYTALDGAVEHFGADGKLISRNERGLVITMTYSDASTSSAIAPVPGLLIEAANPFGHKLQFRYDATGRLIKMIDPSGAETEYEFDGPTAVTTSGTPATRLTKVTYPDGNARTYRYNEQDYTQASSLATSMTGLTDESGTRFASWFYRGNGSPLVSEHALGVERTTLHYGSGAIGVSPEGGSSTSHYYTTIGGVVRTTQISLPCVKWVTCPRTESFAYDPVSGDLVSRTNPAGIQTTYAYDPLRRLETSRTEAAGTAKARTISTQWHPQFASPVQIDEPGRRTTFTHDSHGNVLTTTVLDTTTSEARTWTYTYNASGQVLTADGPRTDVNDITAYTYYSCTSGNQCGRVHTVTNALGHTTTYNSYDAHGKPLTMTDPNGLITTLTYDARQRLTSRTIGSEATTFEYWPTGLLKRTTLPGGSSLFYTYDAAQRLTRIDDSEGNYIVYTLDVRSNRTKEEVFDPNGALRQARSQAYNHVNVLSHQLTAAATLATATVFGYDKNSNITSIAAPLSRTTLQSYDELDRLTTVTDAKNGVTTYGYDALDQLISVTDPRSKVTSYQYNVLGDLLEQVSPDTGTTTNTYDSAGNLATSTDARNETATYGYDALNRVTSVTYADQVIGYTYDTGTNQKGRLTQITDDSGSTSWSYDTHGRVLTRQQTMSAMSKSVSYGYDASGRLQTLTLPSGNVVTYGYANDKVVSLTLNGSTTLLSNVLHHPFGPTTGWTWGNSTLAVREYDQDGKITLTDSAGLKTVAYDNAFRITGITDASDPSLNRTFGYDTLDRLTSATGTSLNQTWTYDANGNRLTQGGSQSSTYTVSPTSNRINAIAGALTRTYGYDNAGNTTSDGSATYTYNDAGRMVSATKNGVTTTYALNGLGQRVRKTTAGASTYFVYDEAGHLIGEYDDSGVLIAETIWFGDIPVVVLKPNGGGGVNAFYVHSDHLNSPRRITRPSDNAVVWKWESDPFGTTLPDENPSGVGVFVYNLRFPGQYYDSETGLQYNYFRDYDPATGRYVQSDPIGLKGGINTYAYAAGNPITLFDSSGLKVEMRCRRVGNPFNTTLTGQIGLMLGVLGGEHCYLVVSCPDIPETTISYPANAPDERYSNAGAYRPLQVFPPGDEWKCPTCEFERCIVNEFQRLRDSNYSMSNYSAFRGPNSNSFARRLVEKCGGTVRGGPPPTGWDSADQVGF